MAVLVAKAELPDALSELPLGHPDRKARQAVGDFEKCDPARQVHTPSPSFTARERMAWAMVSHTFSRESGTVPYISSATFTALS